MDSTTTMRVAMRNGTDPNTKIDWMGFRSAQSVDSQLQTSIKVDGQLSLVKGQKDIPLAID